MLSWLHSLRAERKDGGLAALGPVRRVHAHRALGKAMAEKNATIRGSSFSVRPGSGRSSSTRRRRRLCDAVVDHRGSYLPRQPPSHRPFAGGYAELEQGHTNRLALVRRDLDRSSPKVFLHWYWRNERAARTQHVWLAAGSLGRAPRGHHFLASRLSTEPNLHARVDVRARVSTPRRTGAADERSSEPGVTQRFTIPTGAWRLHATRSELCRRSRTTRRQRSMPASRDDHPEPG